MKCVGLLVVSSDTVVIILGTKTEKQWTGVRTHGFQKAHCSPGMFLSGNHPGPLSALDSEGRGRLYRETGQDDSPRISPGANHRRQPFSTAYFLHELALLPLF